jgi:hypothetical protein
MTLNPDGINIHGEDDVEEEDDEREAARCQGVPSLTILGVKQCGCLERRVPNIVRGGTRGYGVESGSRGVTDPWCECAGIDTETSDVNRLGVVSSK